MYFDELRERERKKRKEGKKAKDNGVVEKEKGSKSEKVSAREQEKT